jgi:hypothetical protein
MLLNFLTWMPILCPSADSVAQTSLPISFSFVVLQYGIIKWPSSKLAAIEKHIATLRAQIEGPEGRGNTQMHADLAQLESQRDRIYAGNVSTLRNIERICTWTINPKP